MRNELAPAACRLVGPAASVQPQSDLATHGQTKMEQHTIAIRPYEEIQEEIAPHLHSADALARHLPQLWMATGGPFSELGLLGISGQ